MTFPSFEWEQALARRCALGDPQAIATFERVYLGEARALLRRRKAKGDHDDILQQVREKLFLGPAPRIASFTGEGSLRSWVRIIVLRTAMNVAARGHDDVPVDDIDAFERRESFDAELSAMKSLYRDAFRRAFRAACGRLEPREKALLRMSAIDRLGVDQIAAVYGTHRSSAARWLDAAKARLRGELRRELKASLRVDSEELASILRLVRSNVPISAEALS